MQRTSKATRRRSRGPTKFPGIVEDAKALGVNRVTLWKMLNGVPGFAGLKTLRQRYDQLQRDKASA
jgi:hypothetical protein